MADVVPRTWRGLVAGLAVAVLLPALAFATRTDLDARWQDYLANRSDLAPAYRFPHATCFKAAALQYDLPESLLLAVARGESVF